MRSIAIVAGVIVLLGCVATPALAIFDGDLDYAGGGLIAEGFWADDSTKLTWEVNWASNVWNYRYTLHVPAHAVSHLILETSIDLSADEITNVQGSFVDGECWAIGTYDTTQGFSNPGMPDSIYGIKFELGGEHTNLWFSFDCPRDPVWGDFYARNGVGGGEPSVLWNAGFVNPDVDPTDPVSAGSLLSHVVRPDTSQGSQPPGDDSPEAATWLLLAATGAVGTRRRKLAGR